MRKRGFVCILNRHSWGIGVTYYPGEWLHLQIGPVFLGWDNAYVSNLSGLPHHKFYDAG